MDLILSIFSFVTGLIVGSFLNCLIWRLYKNETVGGRSYCPKCRTQIAWYDNIPVLSFIILGGKCRHCRKNISWQYPLVEIITALLFLLTFSLDSTSPQFSWLILRDWFIIVTLVIVFVYDFRWQLVPMTIIWPMSIVFFGLNLILGFSFLNLIFSALGVALFFWLQYIITKKRGLGEGDIWLGLMLGLAFPGFSQLFLILVLAYSLGAFVGLFLMLLKNRSSKTKIALGPFLAFGAIITLIWGERILHWYFNLFY